MDHIANLLPNVIRKRGLQRECEASLIVHKANEWISEQESIDASCFQATEFTNGVLIIEANDSIAHDECEQYSTELLSFLRQECASASIDHVHVKRKLAS